MVLWPLTLGKEHQLTAREFLHLYRVQNNLGSLGVYNFQTKQGKLIQLESKYSRNRWWKNKFFFVSKQWEFAPLEQAQGPQILRETNMPAERANQEPILTKDELTRVNDVLKWSRLHDDYIYYGVLGSVLRLMEFVYMPATHMSSKPVGEATRIPVNPSPLAANTWGATPKGQGLGG